MAGIADVLGSLLQGGMTSTGGGRVGSALGTQGLGQAGGLLEQILGGKGGSKSGAGMLGDILGAATSMLGSGAAAAGRNPAAAGGLGALAGALLGGGSGAGKGGAMALLAGLAFQAFKTMNREPAGASSFTAGAAPLGLRAPENPDEEKELEDTAQLVFRGMINAAKADGQIGVNELQKIVGRLKDSGADAEVQQLVMAELQGPQDLDELVASIPNEAVAAQVYAASLFAINVDTDAERRYLADFAQRTGLDQGVAGQLNQAVGV